VYVYTCMYIYICICICVCVCAFAFSPLSFAHVQCCSSLQKKSGRNCSAGTDPLLFSVEKVLAGWFLMKIKI